MLLYKHNKSPAVNLIPVCCDASEFPPIIEKEKLLSTKHDEKSVKCDARGRKSDESLQP